MSLSKEQINRLIEAIKKHVNWLTYALGGDASLTPDELAKIESDKTLPSGLDVGLVQNSYVLGMLRMLTKKGEYQDLTYEQLIEAASSERTPVEELSMHQALHSAGVHLKRLGQDIADGAYDDIVDASSKTVNEAVVQGIVRDEVAFGMLKRKNYASVASDLAHRLKTDWRRDWRMVAETELHRAKVQGQVQAIVNKIDVYAYGEGPDSNVSVVPAPDRCVDCHHYYTKDGNPLIFKLSELMAAGSNGDEGVSHKRQNGKHAFWKPTLPPLHPRCGCNLVYVPPGYSWVNNTLKLTDKDAYRDSFVKKSLLSKGNGTEAAKDSGKTYSPFKAKATPMGPASSEKAEAAPPSSPGIDSPGRPTGAGIPKGVGGSKTGPLRPPSAPAGAPAAGPAQNIVDCPLGVQRCTSLGGTGKHDSASSKYQEHQQMSMQGMAALGVDPQAGTVSAEQMAASQQRNHQGEKILVTGDKLASTLHTASTWNPSDHATQKTLDHLSVGTVAIDRKLNGGSLNSETEDVGVYKLTIEGNGSGCFKPERPNRDEMDLTGYANAESNGVIAENTSHKREVAAFKHSASYGGKQVPVTTYRNHDGREGSIQAWVEGGTYMANIKDSLSEEQLANYSFLSEDQKKNADAKDLHRSFNAVKYLIETSNNPDQVVDEISRAVVHDLMINNCDGHLGNFKVNNASEGGEVKLTGIDKGLAFGRGMKNQRSMLGALMRASGNTVKIPADLEKQMKARSFADELRTVGSDVSPREAAETFLRTKYLLHLQETEGHLDHRNFYHQFEMQGDLHADPYEARMFGKEVLEAPHKGSTDDKFNWFVGDYLKAMDDESHPHHKELNNIQTALNTEDRSDEHPIDRAHRVKQQRQQENLKAAFAELKNYHKNALDSDIKTGAARPGARKKPIDKLSDPF